MRREQAIVTMQLAINVAMPVGLGIIQWKPKNYTLAEVTESLADSEHLYVDYFKGRQVKLGFIVKGSKYYLPSEPAPDPMTQSWAHFYPTYEALEEAAAKLYKRGASKLL